MDVPSTQYKNCRPVDGHVDRRNGQAVIQIPSTRAIINYNANMGGVDLADQKHSYYSVLCGTVELV